MMNIMKDAFEKSSATDIGIREAVNSVQLLNITPDDIFNSIRRAYSNILGDASDEEIKQYFGAFDETELIKHIHTLKGFLLENEVEQELIKAGYKASLFEETNHPDSDIKIETDNEETIEFQIKATENNSYVNQALEENPDISIIATNDIENIGREEEIINTSVSEEALSEILSDCIKPIPISIEGLIIKGVFAALTGGASLFIG